MALPVLTGYAFLEWRGARLGSNASYDAYKLFAVFYPLLLPTFCWWVTLRRSHRLAEWLLVASGAMIVLGFNLVACFQFVVRLSHPPLIVDTELPALRRIEAMADVKSINLLIPDMWSRLWANAFLLRKEQYFLTHTYEGRRNTPLRGEWDLEGGLIALLLPDVARRQITPRFALLHTRDARFLRAEIGEGWHQPEHLPNTSERWQWTTGDATIEITNPQSRPLKLRCTLDGRALGDREVFLAVTGTPPKPPGVTLLAERGSVRFPDVNVPPGKSTLVLGSPRPAEPGGPTDSRPLGVCLFRFSIEVVDETPDG